MVLVCRMLNFFNPIVSEVFPDEQLEDAKTMAEILTKRDNTEYKVFVPVPVDSVDSVDK